MHIDGGYAAELPILTVILGLSIGALVCLLRRRRRRGGASGACSPTASQLSRRGVAVLICRNPTCAWIEPTRRAKYCPKCGGAVVKQQRTATFVSCAAPPRSLVRRAVIGVSRFFGRGS